MVCNHVGMTDHAELLKSAADSYRLSLERAKELQSQAALVQREASDTLANVIRAAYNDPNPNLRLRKSAILRATDHVWSRTWLDRALKTG
jgi:hypothetical protein